MTFWGEKNTYTKYKDYKTVFCLTSSKTTPKTPHFFRSSSAFLLEGPEVFFKKSDEAVFCFHGPKLRDSLPSDLGSLPQNV